MLIKPALNKPFEEKKYLKKISLPENQNYSGLKA